MMNFFDTFRSNTYAGTCNQHCFFGERGDRRVGRAYYKISYGGTYRYSFLFSNIIDGTYSNGDISHRNMVCDPYTIHAMRVGRCPADALTNDFHDAGDLLDALTCDWREVTFGGKPEKQVAPAEFFCTDPLELTFDREEYLCVEIAFSGTKIPYMQEAQIPVYRMMGEKWQYDKRMPYPSMVGCDRTVKARIGYLGDSITQGIGPGENSYMHWNAQLSRLLGSEYSYWNLGIGCARANDIATDSAWLYKAKQNDVVFVCCGTNDTWRRYPTDGIRNDIESIVDALNKAGVRVILQTIPPFAYSDEVVEGWKRNNEYIRTVLSKKVLMVFDEGVHMQESEEHPEVNRYGAHPNAEGCAVWAEALYRAIKEKEIL